MKGWMSKSACDYHRNFKSSNTKLQILLSVVGIQIHRVLIVLDLKKIYKKTGPLTINQQLTYLRILIFICFMLVMYFAAFH